MRKYPGYKQDLWNDVRKIWNHLADLYDSDSLHADFITFSGDDAFWIMPNLQLYLETLSSEEQTKGRYLLGGVDADRRESDFPWIGGAGYVVSQNLIRERTLNKCSSKRIETEDLLTSQCLYRYDVKFTDTRDDEGYSRFCRDIASNPCVLGAVGKDVSHTASKGVVLYHYATGINRITLHDKFYRHR